MHEITATNEAIGLLSAAFDAGERSIFAPTVEQYKQFTDWLCEARGMAFASHFEVGEVYIGPNGRAVEVYGL